jgi:hypothetical protein
MGLDVYVGSLTRYYSGDWETVVQKAAREIGMATLVLRPESERGGHSEGDEESSLPNADQVHSLVLMWRDQLNTALDTYISQSLQWDERKDAPYFTDKPAWDCYAALVLWAAYEEHPELNRPEVAEDDWTEDAAFRASTDEGFDSRYPNLVSRTELWLPCDFEFTFGAPDPAGRDIGIGSSVRLLIELETLNARTWKAPPADIDEWRRNCPTRGEPLETCAKFAFTIFERLARASVQNRLPMKLDY